MERPRRNVDEFFLGRLHAFCFGTAGLLWKIGNFHQRPLQQFDGIARLRQQRS